MTFPKDFIWGAATSSYQIEGAALEDGRGECIWHHFSHTPGKVFEDHNGDVACDHYHRYAEDIEMMQALGLDAYRFSISWPRVLPAGVGHINQAGLDFYDRLVDALLDAGIRPFATLYHWDLPQALQDQGGWQNPLIVDWFTDYTRLVTARLGDRVKDWATLNEPWVVAFVGNLQGRHAPGKTDLRSALEVAHHLLLAHGHAMPVIRSEVSEAKAGIVITAAARHAATDSDADQQAVELSRDTAHRWFMEPLFKGHYPENAVRHYGAVLDGIDIDAISEAQVPLDMLGINYYTRQVVRAGTSGEPEIVPQPDKPMTWMDWEVYPDGLYELLMELNNEFDLPDTYITENGAAFVDPATAENGTVADPQRVQFLRDHFNAAGRALAEGVPLKGYFVWSLLDNFEWGYGYDKRFGIIHVDFETQKRTFKQSALFYRDWISQHQQA